MKADEKTKHRICGDALASIDVLIPFLRKHQALIAARGRGNGHLRDAIEGLERTADGLRSYKAPLHDDLPAAIKTSALVAAIADYMATRSGINVVLMDLRGIVQLHQCDDDQKRYLAALLGPDISGLLRYDAGVISGLKALGIVVHYGARDERQRIANIRWLSRHADIYAHVHSRHTARSCSLCRAAELPESVELFDPNYGPDGASVAGDGSVVNGVVQLRPRAAYTHKMCRDTWLQWVAIASLYKTEDEAHAADVKAGRAAAPAAPIGGDTGDAA